MPTRSDRPPLPMLETPLPSTAVPRSPARPDSAVEEFSTDTQVLPSFHVWTLGCQMNLSDSEEMAGALLAMGCPEAATLEEAELIVINTCSIREAAEQKVIGRMGLRASSRRPQPGAAGGADRLLGPCRQRGHPRASLPGGRPVPAPGRGAGADRSAGPLQPDHAGPAGRIHLRACGPLRSAATADRLAGTRASAVEAGRVARGGGVKAWLPIVYGCDKTCTYCIVPFARGPERSRPFDDIVSEAAHLAEADYRRDRPCWARTSTPGATTCRRTTLQRDRGPSESWGASRLATVAPTSPRSCAPSMPSAAPMVGHAIGRVRFVTSHPWDLTDRLISAMAECDSVCEHLHLPVQSGDDEVLHRMGRQYGRDAYLGLVERLRAAVPGISLTTDVITGFCGETEAQFEATLEPAPRGPFRPGLRGRLLTSTGYTGGARLPDDVPRRGEEAPAQRAARGAGTHRTRDSTATWLGRRDRSPRGCGPPATPARPRRTAPTWSTAPNSSMPPATPIGPADLLDSCRVETGSTSWRISTAPETLAPARWWTWPFARAGPYALSGRARRGSTATRDLPPLVVIAGATATGKTPWHCGLASGWAARRSSRADSRQVYRGMDIATAKARPVGARGRAASLPRPGRSG